MRTRLGIGVAAAAVVVAGGAAAAAPWKIQSTDKLTDLASATAAATDGAQAHVTAEPDGEGGTIVRLKVTGFDHDAVGATFGAHVHAGDCVADNGGAALGHYNHGGGISPTTEVWLDLTVQQGGVAETVAEVPFTIPVNGAGSVVIHALPTNTTTGAAGARIACIPVDF